MIESLNPTWRDDGNPPPPGDNMAVTYTPAEIAALENAGSELLKSRWFDETYIERAAEIRRTMARHAEDQDRAFVEPKSVGGLIELRRQILDASLFLAMRHYNQDIVGPGSSGTSIAISLMIIISSRSDNVFGRCSDTVAALGAAICVEERTARRHLADLVRAGIVKQQTNPGQTSFHWLPYPAFLVNEIKSQTMSLNLMVDATMGAPKAAGRPSLRKKTQDTLLSGHSFENPGRYIVPPFSKTPDTLLSGHFGKPRPITSAATIDSRKVDKIEHVPKKVHGQVADAARSERATELPLLLDLVPDAERFGKNKQQNSALDGEIVSPDTLRGMIIEEPSDAAQAATSVFGPVAIWLSLVMDISVASVKSQLGKMRTEWDDFAIVRAAIAAQRTNAISPMNYMRKLLAAMPKKGGGLRKKSHAQTMDDLNDW